MVYAECLTHGDSHLRIAGLFKENCTMNKTDIINALAASADLSKAAAERALDAFEKHLKAHIDAGNRVVLRGFGTFSRGLPATRTGRNPRTGATMPVTVYHRPKGAPVVGEDTLREEIATTANISPNATARVLDALQAVVATQLRKGGEVSLNGFGSFRVGRRAARNGRNPRTGDAILIPAATVPRFKASKAGNVGAKFSAGSSLKAALR
jgi:DNA-binding protein HU-beta